MVNKRKSNKKKKITRPTLPAPLSMLIAKDLIEKKHQVGAYYFINLFRLRYGQALIRSYWPRFYLCYRTILTADEIEVFEQEYREIAQALKEEGVLNEMLNILIFEKSPSFLMQVDYTGSSADILQEIRHGFEIINFFVRKYIRNKRDKKTDDEKNAESKTRSKKYSKII